MGNSNFIMIPPVKMAEQLLSILLRTGMEPKRAEQCAEVFTTNSVDGVYTHGINRFPRFIEYIRKGYININAEPVLKHKTGGIEQWDGNFGPGILNALAATDGANRLADQYGIGCVALANTNHWMRGGTYGWKAAKAGYVFIGWTNTIANMPAWGAIDARLGNNPLVIAIPCGNEAIVLDMATSQFSFGAMEKAVLENKRLPQPGGYDSNGLLTDDPAEILATRRSLPVGCWKGAGLSLLLDLLAAVLSGGLATHDISKKKIETGLSQVYVSVSLKHLQHYESVQSVIKSIINDYHQSIPVNEKSKIVYPGERVLRARHDSQVNGIAVNAKIWNEIVAL